MVFGNLNSIFSHFQTKDLGKLKCFMGIEIAQSNSGVVMSQRKCLGYIGGNWYARLKTYRHSYGFECQACTWTGGASMRSKEISTTSGKNKLPYHHPTRYFFYYECS